MKRVSGKRRTLKQSDESADDFWACTAALHTLSTKRTEDIQRLENRWEELLYFVRMSSDKFTFRQGGLMNLER